MEEKKMNDEVVVAKNAITDDAEMNVGMTDEDIAKAILQSIEYSKTITYFDEWGNCKAIKIADVLDFIHRLQRENERLNDMKFTQEHCDLYEENEWLKQTINGYVADQEVWVSGYQNAQKENEQLKAEIERLKSFIDFKTANVMCDKCKQQTEQHTAKEILLSLIGCEKQIDPLKTGIRWSVLKGFCKKFGVEME